jgi:hypothetical protein
MPWKDAPKNPAYGTAAWRRASAECLRRAQGRCEARLEDCQGAASQADHIYGLAADPEHRHLRAVCKSCHGKITAQQGGGYRKAKDPDHIPRMTW